MEFDHHESRRRARQARDIAKRSSAVDLSVVLLLHEELHAGPRRADDPSRRRERSGSPHANLWEETGGSDAANRHSTIYREFLRDGLGIDVDALQPLLLTTGFVRDCIGTTFFEDLMDVIERGSSWPTPPAGMPVVKQN
jgi:hypothetical protein